MKRKMIVLELNEADRYFLEKFSQEGLLPTFKKLLEQGQFIETRIKGWEASQDKAWRDISPWIVWPSVYTGFTPSQHGIVGFGQDPAHLVGNCIWDKLNERGYTTGVMHNLMSHPARYHAQSLFYLPEVLASTSDCLPGEVKPVQDFLIYTARHYSESFLSTSLTATYKLLKSVAAGLPLPLAFQLLAQVPLELTKGVHFQRNRALLQAKLQMSLFARLYAKHKPDYATLHMNHIAYMQHRYWRAHEPEFFKDDLSPLDKHYFDTLENRKKHEVKLKDAIQEAYVLTDTYLARLLAMLEEDAVLVILSGLGQRRMDPAHEIHNPELRLINVEKLLKWAGVGQAEILMQMNPDVTLNFKTESEATEAAHKIQAILVLDKSPFFFIQQIGHQLFLECSLPADIWECKGEVSLSLGEARLPLFDFVRLSRAKDQSTAHHRDNGWLLIFDKNKSISQSENPQVIDITEIHSLLMNYFA